MYKKSNEDDQKITLLSDQDWGVIDGVFCRVIRFIPMAKIEKGKVVAINGYSPYAAIDIECGRFPRQELTGFISHKLDFAHLWNAFKIKGVGPDEEVNIFWSKKNFTNWLYKVLSFAMPRLWVMICHKGAFELMADPSSRPDLTGEARAMATLPIVEWKPKVMR